MVLNTCYMLTTQSQPLPELPAHISSWLLYQGVHHLGDWHLQSVHYSDWKPTWASSTALLHLTDDPLTKCKGSSIMVYPSPSHHLHCCLFSVPWNNTVASLPVFCSALILFRHQPEYSFQNGSSITPPPAILKLPVFLLCSDCWSFPICKMGSFLSTSWVC